MHHSFSQNTLNLMGSQAKISFGNSLDFQAQIEDLHLNCCILRENPKITAPEINAPPLSSLHMLSKKIPPIPIYLLTEH